MYRVVCFGLDTVDSFVESDRPVNVILISLRSLVLVTQRESNHELLVGCIVNLFLSQCLLIRRQTWTFMVQQVFELSDSENEDQSFDEERDARAYQGL